MRNKNKQCLALGLSLCLSTSLICMPASAAAPVASYDESLYFNLTPYGAYQSGSVVKSYSMNGTQSVTDYGLYGKVVNMSDYTKPSVEGDAVTFQFTDNAPDRFYFEGTFTDAAQAPLASLPWSVDVSYLLNGVPTAAEELAGKQGLVQINIDLYPSQTAPDYYRNNMILQIASIVNMDETLSVSAPGAQVQSLGNRKAIIFMALPGEQQHFSLSIGSNDFQFAGLTFLMIPATLSQLDQIADLRDVKADVEDSADAISDSMDIILNTMSSMQNGMLSTANGLDQLDAARAQIAAGKGEVYANADQALADLGMVGEALQPTAGHLLTAQTALTDTNQQLNTMVTTLLGVKTDLEDTRTSIKGMQDNVKSLQGMLTDLDKLSKKRETVQKNLDDSIYQLERHMDHLNDRLKDLQNVIYNKLPTLGTIDKITKINGMTPDQLKGAAETLAALKATDEAAFNAALAADPAKAQLWQLYSTGNLAQSLSMLEMVNDVIGQTNSIIGQVNTVMQDVKNPAGDLLGQLGSLCVALGTGDDDESITDNLRHASDLLNEYLDLANKQNGTASSLLDQSNKVGDILRSVTQKADTSLDQISGLQDIVNQYEPQAQQALEDSKTMVNSAIAAIGSTKTFLGSAETLMQQAGPRLDGGTQQSLNGLSDVLRNSAHGLSQTGVLKAAKNTIKDSIQTQWDKNTGDINNLLNMDATAPAQSFTSSKNTAPQTLQVIMRTQEITTKDEDDTVDKDESFQAEGTFFSRVGAVFKAIGDAVGGLFS